MPDPFLIVSQSDYLIQTGDINSHTEWQLNSADSDQLASSEVNRSGSTLFAKAGHIRVQQGLNDNTDYGGQITPSKIDKFRPLTITNHSLLIHMYAKFE